jgi:hypothetical protein
LFVYAFKVGNQIWTIQRKRVLKIEVGAREDKRQEKKGCYGWGT